MKILNLIKKEEKKEGKGSVPLSGSLVLPCLYCTYCSRFVHNYSLLGERLLLLLYVYMFLVL